MFRITRIFENEVMVLYKVEGKLTDEEKAAWDQELNAMKDGKGRQILLDLGQVWHLGSDAMRKLIADSDHWFLLNCSMELRNRMTAAGRTSRVLG